MIDRRSPIPTKYSLHGQNLEVVNSARYLGVDIASYLSWKPHITRITNNANKSLGFLRSGSAHAPVNGGPVFLGTILEYFGFIKHFLAEFLLFSTILYVIVGCQFPNNLFLVIFSRGLNSRQFLTSHFRSIYQHQIWLTEHLIRKKNNTQKLLAFRFFLIGKLSVAIEISNYCYAC